MTPLSQQIDVVKKEIQAAIQAVKNEHMLEQIRIDFLGRKGKIADLMHQLKQLSVEEKRTLGPLLNDLKQFAQQAYEQAKEQLTEQSVYQEQLKHKYFDVTAYKYSQLRGTTTILTQLQEQLEDIFISMGYTIVDGPEVETDYYNFEALNIPKDHPARDMQDTFWLDVPSMLLRTHTSTVQTHVMETQKPPIAVFAPGRVYRNEATDASHNFMFMQGEGLLIDKNVSVANLIATARAFLQKLFDKKDLDIRVRPGFFPFVEPGLEIDFQCPFCTNGCSVCKGTRWIEMLGCGLVHPNVLRASGIDPDEYSGFAFGFGLDRIAMIKYGINDIRLFQSDKPSFLDQF